MLWLWEGGVLTIVGFSLRRALGMEGLGISKKAKPQRLKSPTDPVYLPLASEIEAQTTILAVSLNDAFEECKAGRADAAISMLGIFATEWTRLTGLVDSTQHVALRHLPMVDRPIPVRDLQSKHFRSGTMTEFVKFHGFVGQFVFRPKLRFQLSLRLQRRAIALLSGEFQRIYSKTEEDEALLGYILAQLDLYFHDMDRLAKETLLAFRAELSCLPENSLPAVNEEVQDIVSRGVLKPLAPVHQ